MALGLGSNGNTKISLAGATPSSNALSVTGWCYHATDLGAGGYGTIVTQEKTNGDGLWFGIERDSNNAMLAFSGTSVQANALSTVGSCAPGNWLFFGMTSNSTISTIYACVPPSQVINSSTSSTYIFTPDSLTFGRHIGFVTDNMVNGRFASIKIWNTATVLTAAEIQNEMNSYQMKRVANRYGWYPMLDGIESTLKNDYGGGGITLTQAETFTVQHGPPIGWQ